MLVKPPRKNPLLDASRESNPDLKSSNCNALPLHHQAKNAAGKDAKGSLFEGPDPKPPLESNLYLHIYTAVLPILMFSTGNIQACDLKLVEADE